MFSNKKLLNCSVPGNYPKSFNRSGLVKIIHDKILESNGDCNKINKLIKFYDLILTFQGEIEINKLSDYFKNQIKIFKSIPNLIGYYFINIRKIMIELNIRDDLVLSNDHLYRIHLKTIISYAKQHKY